VHERGDGVQRIEEKVRLELHLSASSRAWVSPAESSSVRRSRSFDRR
jgi:hypothetical protein